MLPPAGLLALQERAPWTNAARRRRNARRRVGHLRRIRGRGSQSGAGTHATAWLTPTALRRHQADVRALRLHHRLTERIVSSRSNIGPLPYGGCRRWTSPSCRSASCALWQVCDVSRRSLHIATGNFCSLLRSRVHRASPLVAADAPSPSLPSPFFGTFISYA